MTFDISPAGLSDTPIGVYEKMPKVYLGIESNADRLIWEDEELTIYGADQKSFKFDDTRVDLIKVGDKIKVNGNYVYVVDVQKSGNTYTVTIPKQNSTITQVIIPARLTKLNYAWISLDSSGSGQIQFRSIEKPGRSLRFKLLGTHGTVVNNIQINLWKEQ